LAEIERKRKKRVNGREFRQPKPVPIRLLTLCLFPASPDAHVVT